MNLHGPDRQAHSLNIRHLVKRPGGRHHTHIRGEEAWEIAAFMDEFLRIILLLKRFLQSMNIGVFSEYHQDIAGQNFGARIWIE